LQIKINQVVEDLLGDDFSIGLGSSGNVRFTDPHRSLKARKEEDELENVQRELRASEENVETLKKRAEAIMSKEVVATVTLGAMSIDDPEPVESEATNTETVSQKAGEAPSTSQKAEAAATQRAPAGPTDEVGKKVGRTHSGS